MFSNTCSWNDVPHNQKLRRQRSITSAHEVNGEGSMFCEEFCFATLDTVLCNSYGFSFWCAHHMMLSDTILLTACNGIGYSAFQMMRSSRKKSRLWSTCFKKCRQHSMCLKHGHKSLYHRMFSEQVVWSYFCAHPL